MNLSAFWIRRPVFTIVFSLIPMLLGLFALSRLDVRELPAIDIPFVVVTTVLPGATPEQIESQVTTPIEQAISTISGIDTVASSSQDGLSQVNITFAFGKDPTQAVNEVQAKIEQLGTPLPTDAERPTVAALSLDSVPVIYLKLASKDLNPIELTDLAERVLQPQISSLPGVGSLQIVGERRAAMRIDLDPLALGAHRVTAAEVVAAISAQNADLPAGTIEREGRRVSVAAETGLDRPEDFAAIIVQDVEGVPLRVEDLGRVRIGSEPQTTLVRVDGDAALVIAILRQSTANPLDLAKAVAEAVPALDAALPANVDIAVVLDRTVSIAASLAEVEDTLLIAIGLVLAVILLFLASLRSSLIAIVTIPLSLLSTLGFIWLMDFSLNTFTLLAFVLAIGLVVDDAIVDIENVQRHIQEGLSPIDAAFVGSAEIGFAIVATTLTLAAVYVPIGLAPGTAGALFREFGLTLAVAVIISGVISRTLSPMMCSRMLRRSSGTGVSGAIERTFEALAGAYRSLITAVLKTPSLALAPAAAVLVIGGLAATKLPATLAPVEDQGFIFAQLEGPPDAEADYLTVQAAQVEAIFDSVPEGDTTLLLLGVPSTNQAYAFLLMKPWSERKRDVTTISNQIRPQLQKVAGVRIDLIDPSPLGGASGKPLQLVVKSTGTYEQIAGVVAQIVDQANASPMIDSPSIDLEIAVPRVRVDVERELAANLGIAVDSVGSTLQTLLGGVDIGDFGWRGNLYKIYVEMAEEAIRRPDAIGTIYLRGNSGLTPLSALVDVERIAGASLLPHFNQLRSATVSANPAPGVGTNAALSELERIAQSELLPGMQIDFDGTSRQLKAGDTGFALVFLLAIVVIYLVLAAQFESFREPILILLVVPISIAGALLTLALFGGGLSIYSAIGFITLIGLIAKHGILIVEFANQLRDRGLAKREAVIEAATTRLRPILMTTMAMVLGALPLALASGAGSASRHEIGLVIVGGMVFGTVVSLGVVPLVYDRFAARDRHPPVDLSDDAKARVRAMASS